MEWISVNDRLPDGETFDCLVYCPETFPKNIRLITATYYADNQTFYGDSDDNPHEDVTHWMPLPQPPKPCPPSATS
jgi:hypothetical protein